jgi:hypothetical protein
MQSDAVTYGHIIFQDRWKLSIGNMNYGIILNIRISADPDVVNIAANSGVKPDTGMRTNHHIANYLGAILDKYGFIQLGTLVQIGSYHSRALKINPYYNSGEK